MKKKFRAWFEKTDKYYNKSYVRPKKKFASDIEASEYGMKKGIGYYSKAKKLSWM